MLEQLADENAEKLRIIKVNANEHRNWAMRERIKGVPTIQFYKDGMKMHELAGAYPKSAMQQKIDQYAAAVVSSSDSAEGGKGEPAIKPMPKDWLPPGVTRQ